ncbi:hypothetical protein KIL84_017297 [Mauremys mutica]|uniref:Uncharacterized protein n=1 Tax=Mauremys mutica TaxID=74926 RepID=A0A9D4AWP7_9SAUR|nr:hypothetical protein KIL84_017297 [Mauremys mutica]
MILQESKGQLGEILENVLSEEKLNLPFSVIVSSVSKINVEPKSMRWLATASHVDWKGNSTSGSCSLWVVCAQNNLVGLFADSLTSAQIPLVYASARPSPSCPPTDSTTPAGTMHLVGPPLLQDRGKSRAS